VVWNHTLNVEKITSPEIGEILGQDKYKQVNDDITGALGLVRAMLDGLGTANKSATELAVKSVIEEINYARRQVTRWIYKEYREVAKAMGFDRIPKVRFDDMALRDEIQMMTLIQGMIDRRIISYRTGQKYLGFDPETELSHMKDEKKLITDGVLGLVGGMELLEEVAGLAGLEVELEVWPGPEGEEVAIRAPSNMVREAGGEQLESAEESVW